MKLNIHVKKFPLNPFYHKNMGSTHTIFMFRSSDGYWYPKISSCYPDTFQVRTPNKRNPNTYLNHFYTKKYARQCLIYDPQMYYDIHHPTLTDTEKAQIRAYIFAKQINPEVLCTLT